MLWAAPVFAINIRAFFLTLLTTLGLVGAAAAMVLPEGWQLVTLPGAQSGNSLQALTRAARVKPARYRLIVVPGSGCTGWLPVADRYFSGLLHAELLVLHKPGVDVNAGLAAACSPDFIQNDALSLWSQDAHAALRAYYASSARNTPTVPPVLSAATAVTRTATPALRELPALPALPELPDLHELPALLLGISEGAELLPDLATEVPALAGLVIISASGLDPREAGELQAQRLGHQSVWRALAQAQSSDLDDHTVVQGRTLRYWRDLWQWPLKQPLLQARWPLLRVWGDADEAVPLLAYQRFAPVPHTHPWPFCDLRLQNADHGLQSPALDGLQWLWVQLERWARQPDQDLCGAMRH